MSQLAPTSTSLPQSATNTRRMVDFTLPLLIAAIGLPLIGVAYLTLTGSMPALGPLTGAQAFLVQVMSSIPSALMAFAMFALRKVLIEYERGQFLSAVATTKFQQVGYYAMAAVLVKVIAVPATWAALLGNWTSLLGFDTFDVSLLLFGGLLAMVGTAFASAAAAIKADNDEII